MCLQGRKVTPVLLPLLSGTQVLNFTSNFCYLILQPLQRKNIYILALLGVRNRLNICPSTSLEEAWKGITDANNMQSICIYNPPLSVSQVAFCCINTHIRANSLTKREKSLFGLFR